MNIFNNRFFGLNVGPRFVGFSLRGRFIFYLWLKPFAYLYQIKGHKEKMGGAI